MHPVRLGMSKVTYAFVFLSKQNWSRRNFDLSFKRFSRALLVQANEVLESWCSAQHTGAKYVLLSVSKIVFLP